MQASLKVIGDWSKDVRLSLQSVHIVSTEIIGKTGEDFCRQVIVGLAKAASSLTHRARKQRPVEHDFSAGRDVPFLSTYSQHAPPSRIYKFMFSEEFRTYGLNPPKGTWDQAKRIKKAGLAARSWIWSLASLGESTGSNPLPAVTRLFSLTTEKVCGYIMESKLSYVLKALPTGWESECYASVSNRIMGTARDKLMHQWARAVGQSKGTKTSNRSLADFFLKVYE